MQPYLPFPNFSVRQYVEAVNRFALPVGKKTTTTNKYTITAAAAVYTVAHKSGQSKAFENKHGPETTVNQSLCKTKCIKNAAVWRGFDRLVRVT